MSDCEKEEHSNFRIQNKRLHLTYKSHIPPEAWLTWFKNCKKKTISFYSIVHESSDEHHPYDHTHILVEFEKVFQTRNARYFDWELPDKSKIHPHIKPVKTKKHWDNTLKYHYKENSPYTNVEKPLDKSEIEEIWKHDTLKKALLSTCTTLNNVGGVIAAFNCKPSDYGIEPEVDWKPWQKDLIEELKESPDPRKIHWYFDHYGNSGKSFFTKHFGMYKGAFVSTKANTYHVATALDEYIRANGQDSVLIVIFNFTRQQESRNIYQALEELKDGMVTSEKYKGRTMFFPNPHLICFANYLPDVTTVTQDRWDIRVLQNEKVVKRYVDKKIFSLDVPIDPYIQYKLSYLDSHFDPIPNVQNNQDNHPDVSALNITAGAKVASLPGLASLPQTNKINDSNDSTEQLVPPNKTNLKNNNLAPLGNQKAPQKVPEIDGCWTGGRFVAENKNLNYEDCLFHSDGTNYRGRFIKGTFYPIPPLSADSIK